MSEVLDLDYDDAALIAFPPDGPRAAFLHARMIERLAQSVQEIVRGCFAHLQFDEGIARLSQRIRESSRVAPELYCIYFDLLQAVRQDDLDASAGLLTEMNTRIEAPLPSSYRRWGALPESTARRYFRYLNVDPSTPFNFKALSASEFDHVCRIADDAFAVFERVAPEIAAEIRSLVREIVFVSGAPNASSRFHGATSFFCWGALFLNADDYRSLVKLINGLCHESTHVYLFALSLGDSFVDNPDDEVHPSPLRADPRPLDGTFHATYVSARMHYALSHVIASGVLSERDENEARKALAASCAAFSDGFKTLGDYASLTALGRRVMNSARGYMVEQAGV
jgi:HEXXH motif-containing protein